MSLVEASLVSIFSALANPLVFLPAIVIGVVARAWWQVVLGAVLLTAALLGISIATTPLPEGGSRVWTTVPLGVIAPLAWAAVAFRFKQWRRARGGASGSPGATLAWVFGGVFLGLIVGAAVGVGAGMLFVELAHVSSFEGASGYLVFFAFMPGGAILGAIAGGILGAWRARRSALGRVPVPTAP